MKVSKELIDGDDYKWRCLECGQRFATYEEFEQDRLRHNPRANQGTVPL